MRLPPSMLLTCLVPLLVIGCFSEEEPGEVAAQPAWSGHPDARPVVGDFDGDGHLDVLIVEATGGLTLFKNTADGGLSDLTERAGLAGVREVERAVALDADADGDLDLGLVRRDASGATTDQLFRQTARGIFELGHEPWSSSDFPEGDPGDVATGDLNADGARDRVIASAASLDDLVELGTPPKSWVTLRLEDAEGSRTPFGARVRLTCVDRSGERRGYERAFDATAGSAPELQLDLQGAHRITSLEVTWPNATHPEPFLDARVNHIYLLRQSTTTASPILQPPRN